MLFFNKINTLSLKTYSAVGGVCVFVQCSRGRVSTGSVKWLGKVQDNWGYVVSSVCGTSALGVRDLKTLAQQLPIISNPRLKKSIVGQLSLRAAAYGGSKGQPGSQARVCVCACVCVRACVL